MNMYKLARVLLVCAPLGACAANASDASYSGGSITPPEPISQRIVEPALSASAAKHPGPISLPAKVMDQPETRMVHDAGSDLAHAVAGLSPDDRALLSATVQVALEAGAVGQTFTWSSPQRGVNGGVTPFERYVPNGPGICRMYDQFVAGDFGTVTGQGRACRTVSGVWSKPGDLKAPMLARANKN